MNQRVCRGVHLKWIGGWDAPVEIGHRPVNAMRLVPLQGRRHSVGFVLGTGYFQDPAPQLEEWLGRGIITRAQYRAVMERDLPDS